MRSKEVRKGSWLWTLGIAELTAWATVVIVFALIQASDLPATETRIGLALVATLAIWFFLLFRFLLASPARRRRAAVAGVISTLVYASAIFALLRGEVPSAQLVFVPVIVVTGLLAGLVEGVIASVAAVVAYWAVAMVVGPRPDPLAGMLNSAIFVLSGAIAGLLARQLREHYRGELEEHRLATAVRHRLLAVLDAVDEAIVFRDNEGVVRVMNQRAVELFDVAADAMLGEPVVELLRKVARQTEEPEDFMEMFQVLRDDPERELRAEVDQILPRRRKLRLYSAPTFDDSGVLVGRIDVYTDISESTRRAEEIERLYVQARKTAESYQRSLLPDATPSLPRVNLVAHYVPAAGRRAVCGDFYDFLQLRDGRVGLVIGDVCGIGPEAASDSALARYTLRSFASVAPSPNRLMRWMNAYLADQLGSDRFVRLVYCTLDPERASLDYSNAGHTPPVLYRVASREIERLEEGGIALGLEREAEYKVGRVELEPGDMLVLYTDGVTEAPRDRRPLGQGRFGDLVQEYGVGTPGELVQALRRAVEAWVGDGELRDDIALVVLEVVPDVTLAEPARELVLPNEPARLGEVRRFVAAFLQDLRAPVEASQEVLLAVGEAAANASRHGCKGGDPGEMRVRCALEGTRVRVTVADEGPGFDPGEIDSELPDRFASGGRGLFLMRELMDDVEVEVGHTGTTVTLTRDLLPERGAA